MKRVCCAAAGLAAAASLATALLAPQHTLGAELVFMVAATVLGYLVGVAMPVRIFLFSALRPFVISASVALLCVAINNRLRFERGSADAGMPTS